MFYHIHTYSSAIGFSKFSTTFTLVVLHFQGSYLGFSEVQPAPYQNTVMDKKLKATKSNSNVLLPPHLIHKRLRMYNYTYICRLTSLTMQPYWKTDI